MSDPSSASGPDLTQGTPLDDLPRQGILLGRVGDEPVLLVRRSERFFAIGASCTHYGGPLAEGSAGDATVRCPWHHACFSLETGEAIRAPALSALPCWSVEQRDGKIFVRDKKPAALAKTLPASATPGSIVIVGGGAAGFCAAQRLRQEGFQGSLVMLSNDDTAPVDRPNLSKDYLAGNAPEDWLPLRPEAFYAEHGIDLRLSANVARIDVASREVMLDDGSRVAYERLLLATGADPVRLALPGMELPHVHTLRALRDCRAIVARAATSRRAVVLGASFIGLEVAASLRARGLEVHVVAPDKRPMERILGPQLGDFVRRLHEEHGVVFHLENTPTSIDEGRVHLKSGAPIDAELVVAGVGVRPRTALAESAGLALDRGVLVDAYLETSAPGVFAAGDIARWPDRHSGESIRVEHWVVAERQGQTAALNMLGRHEAFDAVPFFWSQHYDVSINYVGHAPEWDELALDGDIAARDCAVRYKRNGHVLAVATIYRDAESLAAELQMERAAASA